jgi:hypothetical protein
MVKPLQERLHSCRASGARPAGPLTRPHGKRSRTRGERRPISRLQHLREPERRTRRCSGATVGDSPRGPLKQLGKPHSKPAKKPRPNTPRLNTQGMAHATVAPAAHQGGPLKDPLEQAPPRSRPHTSLGWAPPRSRECAYLEQAPPRSRVRTTLERAPPRSRVRTTLERALPRSRALRTRTPVPVCGYGHLMF